MQSLSIEGILTVKDANDHMQARKQDDGQNSSVLWLQGNPGSGKTYLTSKVIDTIQDQISYPLKNDGFVFFYCKRDDEPRDKPLNVLQSFVRQLSTTARNPESMQNKLRKVCKETRENETNFCFEQCKKQILTSLDIYQKTTLVMDAMDGCDPQLRHELVGALKFLLKASKKLVQIVPILAFGHVPVCISNAPMGWDGQQPKELFFVNPDCFIKL